VLNVSWLPTVTLATLWIYFILNELVASVTFATKLAIQSETNVCGCCIAFIKHFLGI